MLKVAKVWDNRLIIGLEHREERNEPEETVWVGSQIFLPGKYIPPSQVETLKMSRAYGIFERL